MLVQKNIQKKGVKIACLYLTQNWKSMCLSDCMGPLADLKYKVVKQKGMKSKKFQSVGEYTVSMHLSKHLELINEYAHTQMH